MRIHDIIESLQLYEAPIGQAISKGVAPEKEIPPTASTTAPIGQPVNKSNPRLGIPAGKQAVDQAVSTIKKVRSDRRPEVIDYAKQQIDAIAKVSTEPQPSETPPLPGTNKGANLAKSFSAGQKAMSNILSPSTWFGDKYADEKFDNTDKRKSLNKISNNQTRDEKDTAILQRVADDIAKNPKIDATTKKTLSAILKKMTNDSTYAPNPSEKDALYAYNKAIFN